MEYKHLSAEERYQIDDLVREGFTNKEIARRLNRSESTLSRELRRNKGDRGWRPRQAHMKAQERLSERGRRNVGRVEDAAWEYAQTQLISEQWSPDQIAARLRLEGKNLISHETIYLRILEDKKSGGTLYTHLRCQKKRKKRYGSSRSLRGAIPDRVDIEQRPAIVASRQRVGDWEGDTIIGTQDGGAVIASMVERKSRYTVLVKAKNKTTAEVTGSIHRQMKPVAPMVYTVTFDNGKEFTHHKVIAQGLDTKIFFAKPYHSWERGLNENTNGLVRQYFPKKMRFDAITDDDLQSVANKLNNRPRKCLGYKTPLEVFSQSCAKRGVPLRI
jgi:transposase, IS30 family